MNDTQEQHRKIDGFKSQRNLALAAWGFLTYVALPDGIGWLATTAGPNPKAVALLAVLVSTTVNWAVFATIERRLRD